MLGHSTFGAKAIVNPLHETKTETTINYVDKNDIMISIGEALISIIIMHYPLCNGGVAA